LGKQILQEKHAVEARAGYRLLNWQLLAEQFWCILKSKLCLKLSEKWITEVAVNDRNSIIEKGNFSALLEAEE